MTVSDIRSLRADTQLATTDVKCTKGETAYDLGLVLNYGYAGGSPQVLRFITEHMELVHRPRYRDWETALTCGTTSAIDMVFRVLCNYGDCILSEEYTYPGTIEAAKCLGLRMVGIKMDEDGLSPDHLELTLRNWNVTSAGPTPKLLYVIPTGQNPTGATQSAERRQAIYRIAEKHNLIILEDDPYYLIRLQSTDAADEISNFSSAGTVNRSTEHSKLGIQKPLLSCDKYLRNLPPSYLSLDTSGRVLRMDATSKILAPGLRCGWITGCSQLIQKFINQTELSTVSPSGPSQALLYKLLDETWGHEGFLNWLIYLSTQYRQRLQTLLTACQRHLPGRLCKWSVPSAGMFLWVQVDWSLHPLASGLEGRSRHEVALEVEHSIYSAAQVHGVLISKGSWFATDLKVSEDVFFRLTFAAADDRDLDEAVARLSCALQAEYRINTVVHTENRG